jgi:hypothetical protein
MINADDLVMPLESAEFVMGQVAKNVTISEKNAESLAEKVKNMHKQPACSSTRFNNFKSSYLILI